MANDAMNRCYHLHRFLYTCARQTYCTPDYYFHLLNSTKECDAYNDISELRELYSRCVAQKASNMLTNSDEVHYVYRRYEMRELSKSFTVRQKIGIFIDNTYFASN